MDILLQFRSKVKRPFISKGYGYFLPPLHFWLLAYDRGGGIFVCIGICPAPQKPFFRHLF
jgi:hypothetical protein